MVHTYPSVAFRFTVGAGVPIITSELRSAEMICTFLPIIFSTFFHLFRFKKLRKKDVMILLPEIKHSILTLCVRPY
jgi:hypothetical protein